MSTRSQSTIVYRIAWDMLFIYSLATCISEGGRSPSRDPEEFGQRGDVTI